MMMGESVAVEKNGAGAGSTDGTPFLPDSLLPGQDSTSFLPGSLMPGTTSSTTTKLETKNLTPSSPQEVDTPVAVRESSGYGNRSNGKMLAAEKLYGLDSSKVRRSSTLPVNGKGKEAVGLDPQKQQRDELIMDTNKSSIVSKRSVEKLYFEGEPEYFRYFVSKFKRRSPLINRGYWLRMKAIEHGVSRFLAERTAKKKVVVNLGCG